MVETEGNDGGLFCGAYSIPSALVYFIFLKNKKSFLSSLFIIVDTQMMMNRLSEDEYIIASIDLVCDLV